MSDRADITDALRLEMQQAHAAIQRTQELAYRPSMRAPLRVRLALNRAQSILIKLLVRYA